MLGKIITSFIDLIHSKHDEAFVDDLISSLQLDNDGAYTDFIIYDDDDLFKLTNAYITKTGRCYSDVWKEFGIYSFKSLYEQHGHITKKYTSLLSVMNNLDSSIHPALDLMYDDIRFPQFKVIESNASSTTIAYSSQRNLVDFAEGLIRGCALYFDGDICLSKLDTAIFDEPFNAVFKIDLDEGAQ
ncbi:heme NO-binding domain-containing protein [Glaciecola sp. MH2013]|uniref:heme NO-binding domain-containing protein n=1 Tax=Glaciecola sp. MH2013 TaxID=2785524 RepID=UPI00189E038A|nr:heme NO-binding domain-containing protein [Glaciecola sp. MH2013]MBF7074331.1 heme NO-binding domain-containing protein [Glaciecola sp. MH2013]